jgi:hypothetical protein
MDFNTRLLNDFNKIKNNIKNDVNINDIKKKHIQDNFYKNKLLRNKQIADYKNEYERIYDSVIEDPTTQQYLKKRFELLWNQLNNNKINTLLSNSNDAVELENEIQTKNDLINDENKKIKNKIKTKLKIEKDNEEKTLITVDQQNDYKNKYIDFVILYEKLLEKRPSFKNPNIKPPEEVINKKIYLSNYKKLTNNITKINKLLS